MRIIVCGGRNFIDVELGFKNLDQFHAQHNVSLVIHGAARGADSVADAWAKSRQIDCTAKPANWKLHGNSAGYLRNMLMADMNPDAVLAFPGGRGTQHMMTIARERGIPVYECDP